MSNFVIEVEGLEEAKKVLAKYPEKAKQAFGTAISKTVRAVRAESVRRAPYRTGRLSTSIHVVKETPTYGEVDAGVKYAIFVHEGTRPSLGRYVPAIKRRIKTGIHPGQRAKPFMRNVVSAMSTAIQRWFGEAMEEIFK